MTRKLFTAQRGAMFGLDTRVAMAIMGGLSIIAGSAYVFSLRSAQAHALREEIIVTKGAIDALQYDMKIGIHRLQNVTSTPDEEHRYNALTSTNGFVEWTASMNRKHYWQGPYLQDFRYNRSQDRQERFGTRTIHHGTANDPLSSCTSSCFLWLGFSSVSEAVALQLNETFDGDETTPENTGKVQWNNSPSGDTKQIYVRLMDAMP